jgi:hypothetical protein
LQEYYISSAVPGSTRSFSVFSGVFIPEELDRGGDKETGDTTMVDKQTLLGVFVKCP